MKLKCSYCFALCFLLLATVPVNSDTGEPKSSPKDVSTERINQSESSEIGHEPAGESTAPSTQADPLIKLDRVSINHGGAIDISSGNIHMGVTIGQPVAGEVAAGNIKMGLGFWLGGPLQTACSCPSQGDMDSDGDHTTLDLGWMIDIIFGGTTDFPNPNCPTSRADFDYDGFPTTLDIGWMIDYLFAGGSGPCNPCNPIEGSCAAK